MFSSAASDQRVFKRDKFIKKNCQLASRYNRKILRTYRGLRLYTTCKLVSLLQFHGDISIEDMRLPSQEQSYRNSSSQRVSADHGSVLSPVSHRVLGRGPVGICTRNGLHYRRGTHLGKHKYFMVDSKHTCFLLSRRLYLHYLRE